MGSIWSEYYAARRRATYEVWIDPTDAQRLWIGGEFLYRTANGAALWTKASTAMPDGGLVSALAVSFGDSNRVAAGTTRGDVLVSTAALSATSATDRPVSRPRDGWVTSVAFDAKDTNVVYATFGNFGGSHVYRSSNGGHSWTALDGSGDATLPDIPVHCIVVDQDDAQRLYLATDIGVFVYKRLGAVVYRGNRIRAGSHRVARVRAYQRRQTVAVCLYAWPRRMARRATVVSRAASPAFPVQR